MELLHDMTEGRDYVQLKDFFSDQDGDRTASENACQKPARNSRRLKKRDLTNKLHLQEKQ